MANATPGRRDGTGAPAGRVEVLNVNHPGRVSTMDARVYADMRSAILSVVPRQPPGALFKELPAAVSRVVDPALFADRSISWYTTTVKLDLEARGLLTRAPGPGPQRLLRTGVSAAERRAGGQSRSKSQS